MSDHLPECDTFRTAYGEGYGGCICEWLRACEQRVREETAEDRDNVRDEAYAHGFNAGREHGEKRGFVRGVQAAYDAVDKRWETIPDAASDWLLVALAAIDALREVSE